MKARTWCDRHWVRWKKYGDPRLLLKDVVTPKTLEERFFEYVQKGEKCWVWNGAKSLGGYGNFNIGNGKYKRAHQVAWFLANGAWSTKERQLDHLCRNPSCVNPKHLEIVAPRENFLRGMSPGAIVRRTGKCMRGHLMNLYNSYIAPDGRVQCKKCKYLTNVRLSCMKKAKVIFQSSGVL
jgi:hypothetical protein